MLRKIFTITFICCVLLSAITQEYDWPQWRGPNRNSISKETNWNAEALKGEPKVLWEINVNKGYSAVAIKGRYLYTMGNDRKNDTVYCIDVNNGKVIWKYSYPCGIGDYPGPRATPTIDGNKVYTLSREGHLFCFNAADGSIIWRKHLKRDFKAQQPSWSFAGSPVIEDNMLIFNAGKCGIALNKDTGKLIWSNGSGVGNYATPVIYYMENKKCVAIFGYRDLFGVEAATGKILWSYKWITDYDVNAADPVVVGNKIFISSNYGNGCALLEINNNKPKLVWKSSAVNSHFPSFVYNDGYIYGMNGSPGWGNFVCIEFNTGKVKWEKNLGFGSVVAAGDKLIMITERGSLHIAKLSPQGYAEFSRAKIMRGNCWTPPVFCRGKILVRNVYGDLLCIDMSK